MLNWFGMRIFPVVKCRLFFKRMAISLLFAILLMAGGIPAGIVHAEDTPYDGPDRRTTITVNVMRYEWWLVWYANNQPACQMLIEHEGEPFQADIFSQCTKETVDAWGKSGGCYTKDDELICGGLYLQQVSQQEVEKEVVVDLPPASAFISLSGCDLQPYQNVCNAAPYLTFTSEEPLPNEMIISIQGVINGEPFDCPGSECTIPLNPTGEEGREVEFWVNSSYGDSSPHFTALVRAVPWGDFMSPEGGSDVEQKWYVDVLSSQWRGAALPSCAESWQVFPEFGGPPEWLTTPQTAEELESTVPYYFLAGMLIENGAVDASTCLDNGLAGKHTANECGIQAAMPQVLEWQNSFDQEIFTVAQDTGVPAQLLKTIFSRESQFWPGMYESYQEVGLGQMTEYGVDTLLLWNPDFFKSYCPLVLSAESCSVGYFKGLNADHQQLMRRTLLDSVNAACVDCPIGIDLNKAYFSVRIFAENLKANCEQVGQMVYNVTGKMPGKVSTYTDLWRFTLANYNSGAGCMADALEKTRSDGKELTWENLGPRLEGFCTKAVDYVNDITSELSPTPTATSWVQFGATPLPRTPTPPVPRTPTRTTTPEATLPIYPKP